MPDDHTRILAANGLCVECGDLALGTPDITAFTRDLARVVVDLANRRIDERTAQSKAELALATVDRLDAIRSRAAGGTVRPLCDDCAHAARVTR